MPVCLIFTDGFPRSFLNLQIRSLQVYRRTKFAFCLNTNHYLIGSVFFNVWILNRNKILASKLLFEYNDLTTFTKIPNNNIIRKSLSKCWTSTALETHYRYEHIRLNIIRTNNFRNAKQVD